MEVRNASVGQLGADEHADALPQYPGASDHEQVMIGENATGDIPPEYSASYSEAGCAEGNEPAATGNAR
jgi:hypothetical protein